MTSWGQELALARRGSALARRRRLLRAFPRPRGCPHSAPLVARHSRPEASSARRLMFRRHDMRRRRRRRQAPARAAVPEASPRPRRLRTPPREGSSLEQPTNSVLCPHLCHLRLLRPARRHLRLRRRKRQPKRRRLPTAQRHGVWKRSDGWRRLADQAAPLRPPLARPDRLRCTSVGRRRRRADRHRKHSSPLSAFPLVVLQVDPKEEAPRPSTKQAVVEEDQWRDTTDLTAAERLGAPATCSVPARTFDRSDKAEEEPDPSRHGRHARRNSPLRSRLRNASASTMAATVSPPAVNTTGTWTAPVRMATDKVGRRIRRPLFVEAPTAARTTLALGGIEDQPNIRLVPPAVPVRVASVQPQLSAPLPLRCRSPRTDFPKPSPANPSSTPEHTALSTPFSTHPG